MDQEQSQSGSLPASLSSLSIGKEPPTWSESSASDASAGSVCLSPDGITTKQIEYVRGHIDPKFKTDDVTIKRFIRATGGNLALSAKRLNSTLAWQAKVQPEKVVCKACVKDPRSHYMHTVGYCLQGRPIIYSCLELPTNKVFEDNRDHMIQTFEMAIKCMPPGVEQWIWVCDFKGFGMADVNPKLAKLFLDISGEHYPERLGLFLVVDAPSLFGMLWRAISHFVDPKTYKKIRFLPFDAGKPEELSKSRLKAEMDLHFDAVTTAWLLREMKENREKAKAAKKVYNMYSIYEQALEGQLCDGHDHKSCHHGHLAAAFKQPQQPAAAAAPGSEPQQQQQGEAGGLSHAVHARSGSSAGPVTVAADESAVHNPIGTPAMLHMYNMNPDLMLPQATATA